jgi:hypothetical protein
MKGIDRSMAVYLPLILLFSLIACSGWLDLGFPKTHEYFAPVYLLMDFDTVFVQGTLLVNWLPSIGGGGQPIFTFYPPLSFYAAELFHLAGFTFPDAIKVTVLASYFLSGITLYAFMNRITGSAAASLVAAAAYIFFPYHLVDSHLRGDLAETFAYIFLPLIAYFLYDAVHRDEYIPASVYAGISFALLITSHILMGYIFGVFLGLYCLYFIISRTGTVRKICSVFGLAGITGLALSSFYWIPALAERGSVNFSHFTSSGFTLGENCISLTQLIAPSPWSWGFSGSGTDTGTMPFSLGIFTLLIVVSMATLIVKRRASSLGTFFLISFIVSCMLAVDIGLPVLNLLPFIDIIQFPWRFLALSAFAASVLAGFVTVDLMGAHDHRLVVCVLVCIILVSAYPMVTIPGGYMPGEPSVSNMSRFYRVEYLPTYEGTAYPPLPNSLHRVVYAGTYAIEEARPTYWRLNTSADEASALNIKIFSSPRWKCSIDGMETETGIFKDGTLSLIVPEGYHRIEFWYGDSGISVASKIITLIGVALVLWLLLCHRYREQYGKYGNQS